MRRSRERIVEESFLDDLCLLLIIIVDLGELLVVERNLVSFDEIIIKVDWQNLRILNCLLDFVRQLLGVNVVSCLLLVVPIVRSIHFPVSR